MHEARVIAGKYRLVSLLGEGGMGAVWRGEHLDLRAPVAVKLLNPHIALSTEGLKRFHREAEAAAALRSPHVVQIIDRGVDDATHQPFIVMELLEGESLAGRLARVGRLSPTETSRIVTHVARALARAHEAGIVHRDLKPDNVFLVRNEDEEIAKVLDFGVAKSEKHRIQHAETRTGAVLGTPYYMSPEQIAGTKGVDHRTDIWALAVIACECLTGKRPFEAQHLVGLAVKICSDPMPVPSRLGPVPSGFDAWFERAAARDPAARFESARAAAEELKQLCGVFVDRDARQQSSDPQPFHEVQTRSTGALVRTTAPSDAPPGSRRRPWGSIAGVVAMLSALGLGGALWLRGSDKEATGVDAGTPGPALTPPADTKPPEGKPVDSSSRTATSGEPTAPTTPGISTSAAPRLRAIARSAPAKPKPASSAASRPREIGSAIEERQ